MKINEINVDSFGKLHNFHMEFKSGFNVIYGNNEDGKSTVMAFIKMMFYGSPSSKINEILTNPRKKFAPLNGSQMSGNIIFENENKTYRLERIFGNSNSDDKIVLFNMTDNIEMDIPDKVSIGQMFFGFSASAFEKTFFINQTGTTIGNDDEINQRLANLNSAGDESISVLKVRSRLTAAKENFKSRSGKVGKLDMRYKKLHEFEELLKQEKKDEQEKISMLKRSKELSEKIKLYEAKYRDDVEKIDTQEKLTRLESLKNNAAYQRTYDELSRKLNERQSCLVTENFTADTAFVQKCDGILEAVKNADQKKISLKTEYDRINNELKAYTENFIIENERKKVNDIQNKILHFSLESKNIDEEIEKIRSAINNTEEKLKNSEIDFHLAESSYKTIDSIYQQKISYAEHQLHEASTPKPIDNNKKSPEKEPLNIDVKTLVSSIILLFAALFAAYAINPAFLLLIIISVVLAVKSLNLKNGKTKDKPFEYVNHVEIAKCTDNLQKIKNEASAEKSSARSNMDNAKNRISEFKSAISKMKTRIPELSKRKREIEESIITLQQQKNHLEIKIAESQSAIKIQQEQLNHIVADINNTEINQKNTISNLLRYFSIYRIVRNMNEFQTSFNELKQIFQDISQTRLQLESLKSSAPIQNDKFSINQVYLQINNLENMLAAKNNGLIPEKIDEKEIEKIKEQSSALLNDINSCKEDYTNINAIMKTKFKDSMGISHIEHEISIIKNEIEENEQFCSNIDTALQYIDEASAEMHQNFGSALNLKTAEIFRRLTGGKYDSVIVSSDFNISVKNPTGSVDWQYLSTGTIDQSYFALRLAVADMLSDKKNSMPVLIDDVFSQYDDIRTKQGLDFLDDYSANAQIIFFTCHGHLIDMCDKNNLNVKISRIS